MPSSIAFRVAAPVLWFVTACGAKAPECPKCPECAPAPASAPAPTPTQPRMKLMRSSIADDTAYHVATFDVIDGCRDKCGEYNSANCEIARDLFMSQPGVVVRYWCEAG